MIVAIVSATYRTYSWHYVKGLVSTLCASDADAEALKEYDIVPLLARGYGGGRNTAQLMRAAAELGADVAVTIEHDIDWSATELAKLLEGWKGLAARMGCPVAVGAPYPASSVEDQMVLSVHPHDEEAVPEVLESIASGNPPERFVEALVLPCGFTAWPMPLAAQCDVVERAGADIFETFDRGLSEALRARGARLAYDLTVNIGHQVDVPTTAATAARRILRKSGFGR